MLTYNLTNIGSDSLYEYFIQMYQKMTYYWEIFGVHEKLPSKRSFRKKIWGISVITVENAYEQLMAEGYIYSIPKKRILRCRSRELNLTKTLSVSPSSTLLSFKEKVPYLADFTSNQTDSEIFPFTIWARTMRELLNENQQQFDGKPTLWRYYGTSAGDCRLSSCISRDGRKPRADHRWSWDRIFIWSFDPASWR